MSDSGDNVNKRQHEGDGDKQQVKRTRYQYNYDDLITVLVGEEEKRFQVHRDTICERSRFFEAAVSTDRWLEGQENLVRLPEGDARSFQMYVHWAYTGKLSPEVFWKEDKVCTAREQLAYYHVYILGDLLDDSDLRTHTLDICISKSVDWIILPSPMACDDIWGKTPEGSPLRAFIVEWKARFEGDGSFADCVEYLPYDFLKEMAVLLMKQRDMKWETPEDFATRIRAKLLPERS